MINARYFASHTPVQESAFYSEQNLDFSIGLSRNECNHTFKYFAKIRVLILILTAWTDIPACSKAMHSEIKAYRFSLLSWNWGKGLVLFDLLSCEGKRKKRKVEGRKRNHLRVLLGEISF